MQNCILQHSLFHRLSFILTDVPHSAALPVRVVPLNVAVEVDLSFSFSPSLLLVSPPLVLSPVPPESYIVSKLSSDDNLIRQSVTTTAVEKFVNSFFSESGKVSSIET